MFHNIVANFRSVSGICEGFVKDLIRMNPVLPPNLITTRFQEFYSRDLRNTFYKEVNLYLDKAIYQYILSRALLRKGYFSWGAVTQYYASFFSVSGLIRLFENGFVRIGSMNVAVESQADSYRIRRIPTEGLHRVVWHKYFSLFKGFDYKPHIFYVVYSPYGNNNYFFEPDRRNDLNYDPASGYQEIYQTSTTIRNLIKERTADSYSKNAFQRINEWIDMDAIVQNRIRLVANIISEIDKLSDFPLFCRNRLSVRRKIVEIYEKDRRIKDRIVAWLEGE